MRTVSRLIHAFACAVLLAASSASALAEVNQIKVGRAISVAYLPIMVMEERKLLEKHARAAGLGDIKVDYVLMTGGTQLNDALLAGTLQIATGGMTPFILLWARTHGNIGVKGLSPFNSTPLYLNTRDPSIKSIKDFTEKDRIAVVGVKSALQAILLEMEASKVFGPDNYAKLDHLTVSMPLADAAAQLISGGSGQITADFTVPPFSYQELAAPGIHTVLTSTDILGGPASYGIAYTTSEFQARNPKTCAAFVAALREAIDIINQDRKAAGDVLVRTYKTKPPKELIDKMMADPTITFEQTPQNIMKYVQFMNRIGTIKAKPESWKDLFFPGEIDKLPGS
ncbi:MAG TPA: ABC transporter substrate-binding protein [Burkholderiales bacterium]|nr:ABC transporter substrate-binding protein [Burkholderiales bacterium]